MTDHDDTPPLSGSQHRASNNTHNFADVRVFGLDKTLEDVRHELKLIGYAGKYDWINKRLVVLRNGIIALAVVAGVILVCTLCYREAYRQTLNIAAFDVPKQMEELNVSGEIVAKTLFDELVKRRKTVTTLDAGDLKEAWTEHGSEVAIPQTHFTLQAVFAYLRHLTGNEIAVDGEMFVTGDVVTVRARVAGSVPITVSGPILQWQSLMGAVADYVYDVTQPGVLASYLGLTASTPESLTNLSRLVVKMSNASPRLSRNVLGVAYDAYGGALMRQDRLHEALAAFQTALHYDPELGLAVMNAAEANFRLDNRELADALYIRAAKMPLSESVKRNALRRRVSLALNSENCATAEIALRDLLKFAQYDELWEQWSKARYLVNCAYAEAKGVDIARRITLLHPDSANAWVYLSAVLTERPGRHTLGEGANAARIAIELTKDKRDILNYFAHTNLITALIALGDGPGAELAYKEAGKLMPSQRRDFVGMKAAIMFVNGDYEGAARAAGSRVQESQRSVEDYHWLGMALEKLGKNEDAIRTLRQGQRLFPHRCDLFDDLGNLFARVNRIEEALAEFDRGILAQQKCGSPYVDSALLLAKSGRIVDAKTRLQAIIRAAPESDGAFDARAVIAKISH